MIIRSRSETGLERNWKSVTCQVREGETVLWSDVDFEPFKVNMIEFAVPDWNHDLDHAKQQGREELARELKAHLGTAGAYTKLVQLLSEEETEYEYVD